MRPTWINALLAAALNVSAGTPPAGAADFLPYSTRTRPYGGWSPAARGDIRTVGMAGSTIGLADTYLAATANPAGLAMTLDHGDFNYSNNSIRDARIQNFESPVTTQSLGVAVNSYPWSVSMGYLNPWAEGQLYSLPNGQATRIDATTRDYSLGVARLFPSLKLSVGGTLTVGRSEIGMETPTFNDAFHTTTIGTTLGAMLQLPYRLLLGISFTPGKKYGADPTDSSAAPVPGIKQDVLVPWRSGLGIGWVPNRSFRMDTSLNLIGATPGAALLANESVFTGSDITVQPSLGLAYSFVELKELKGTLFTGTYFESSRIDNQKSRYHATIATEIKPWIFTVGYALDFAAGYRNEIFSVGFDLFRIMAKMDLIPTAWSPPRGGWLPRPLRLDDTGLARPLVRDWKPHGPDMNPIQVGLELPQRTSQEVKQLSTQVIEVIQPSKKKKPAKPAATANKKRKKPLAPQTSEP